MKFCPKCGQQLADDARFCNHCGNAFDAPAQPQQQGYVPPQQGYVPPQQPGYVPPQQPYYTQASAPAANIVRTPVKTDYSLGLFILLNILTCGIYGYYIVYKLAQDVNQMCAEDGDKVGGLAAYILLSLVTCGIYNIYWLYKIQNRMHMAAPRYRVMVAENGNTILLWLVVGLVVCALLQYVAYNIIFKTANKMGMAYNATYFR